jgi:hypothetical protein
MNERIEELKLQAIDFADATYKYELSEGFQIQEWDKIRLEKFAELIVKECIKVVDDTITENQEMNIGLVMASAAIVSHFGVEE